MCEDIKKDFAPLLNRRIVFPLFIPVLIFIFEKLDIKTYRLMSEYLFYAFFGFIIF